MIICYSYSASVATKYKTGIVFLKNRKWALIHIVHLQYNIPLNVYVKWINFTTQTILKHKPEASHLSNQNQ